MINRTILSAILAQALLHTSPVIGAGTVEMPLAFESVSGFVAGGKTARLTIPFIQSGNEPVVVEVEDADISFEGNANAGRHSNAKCSAGFYVSHIENAVVRFTIATPGSYTVWMRGWYPGEGYWNHEEYMDGTKAGNGLVDGVVVDAKIWGESPLKQNWVWTKGVNYTLGAGTHEFTFCFKGGCRLDKIVFMPEGASGPTDEGSSSGRLSKPITVEVTTLPIKCSSGSWHSLGGDLAPRDGSLTVSASADGLAWTEVPASGELVFAKDWQSIRFRSIFTAGKLQQSPFWNKPSVILEESSIEPVRNCPVSEPISKLPLFPQKMDGVEWDGQSFKLRSKYFVPDSKGALYIEAESAQGQRLCVNATAALPHDSTAIGGVYLRNRSLSDHQLRYDVRIDRKGAYTLWIRVRNSTGKFKKCYGVVLWDVGELKSETATTSNINRPAVAKITNVKFTVPPPADPVLAKKLATDGYEGWVWAKGMKQTLLPGPHSLYFHGGFNYQDIDRLAILPNDMTPDNAAPGTALTPVTEGTVTFTPMSAIGEAIPAKVEPAGTWQVSTDSGLSFSSVPEDGRLPTLSKDISGLVLKATLNSSKQAKLDDPNVILDRQISVIKLRSDAMEVWFETGRGTPLGLYSRHTRKWLTPLQTPKNWLSINYEVPGEGAMRYVPFSDIRLTSLNASTNNKLSATYSLLGAGITAQIDYESGALDGLNSWHLSLSNTTPYCIREVAFPQFAAVRTCTDPMQETLGWPSYFGAAFPYPSGGFAAASTLYYPGTASLSFFSLGNQNETLYVGARQKDGILLQMNLEIPAPNNLCAFSLNKSIAIPPGETWTGDYALGLIAGDWHAALDTHSAWLRTWLPPRQSSSRVADLDGFFNNNVPFFSQKPVDGVLINDWYDMRYNQIWGWTADSDCVGFYPVPDPRFGSPADAKRHLSDYGRQGYNLGYYLNAQGYVREFQTLDPIGWSVPRAQLPKKYADQVGGADFFDRVIERTPNGEARRQPVPLFTVRNAYEMCAGAKEWREHLVKWTTTIWMGDYGVNSLYLDQTGCVYQKCFGQDHEHGLQHAVSGRGFADIARAIRENGRHINPDFVFGIEGMTDRLSSYTDYGLWVGSLQASGYYLKYALPYMQFARGVSNNNWGYYATIDEGYRDIALCNWFDYMDSRGREVLRVRQDIRPFINQGVFKDTVGLSFDNGWITGRWFMRNTGGWKTAAITLHNPDGSSNAVCRLTYSDLKTPLRAFAFVEGGWPRVLPVKRDGERIQFNVPSEKFSTVLLVSECPEADSLLLVARRPLVAGEDEIEGRLLNLSDRGLKAIVAVELQAPLSSVASSSSLAIAGGTSVPFKFPIRGIPALDWWSNAVVTAAAGPSHSQVKVLLAPPLVNGSMERDINRDRHPDGWGSFGGGLENLRRMAPTADIEFADGECDTTSVSEGKGSLLLAEPIPNRRTNPLGPLYPPIPSEIPWSRYVENPVVLKADTDYRLTAKIRAETSGKNQVKIDIPGVTVCPPVETKADGWVSYEHTFKNLAVAGELKFLTIRNLSGENIWIDDVNIEETTH